MQVIIAKIVESYNPAHGRATGTTRSDGKGKSRRLDWFFTPLLGPLLSNRRLNGIFLGVGFLLLFLVIMGYPGWQCPINSTFGVSCPGCGLTTAMTLLVNGQWAAAVGMHAFAPLFMVILALMMIAFLLPADYLGKLSTVIKVMEKKTGITAIILLSMLLYWLLRVFTI